MVHKTLNITVFGAAGETGLLVLQKALAKGYGVTAYASTPLKITFEHNNLQVIDGTPEDSDHIKKAIQGADAVISVLSPKENTKQPLISEETKKIVSVMENYGVNRLIATATQGFEVEEDRFQLSFAMADLVQKIFRTHSYKENIRTGTYVTESNLNWTLVRLPRLSSKPATGKLHIGYHGDGRVKYFSLSREDLANFLVDQVEDEKYIRRAPVLSN